MEPLKYVPIKRPNAELQIPGSDIGEFRQTVTASSCFTQHEAIFIPVEGQIKEREKKSR
jgi:hypothetical protein